MEQSGDTAIVGQPGFETVSSSKGRASIITFSGGAWAISQTLAASDAATGDQFGASVAIDGDVAVVGAPFDDLPGIGNAGSAYVFRRVDGTWAQEAHLLSPDGAKDDHFGAAVGIHGGVIVIGAPDDDSPLTNAGSTYVFGYDGAQWAFQAKVVSAEAAANERLGFDVSVDAGVFAVGGGSSVTGDAYVFRFDGAQWVQETHFTGPSGQSNAAFGTPVAINGDHLAVGMPNVVPHGAVRAYRYAGGSWGPAQELFSSDPPTVTGAHFGAAVAISGDRLAAGAPDQQYVLYPGDVPVSMAGAVGVFRDGGSAWISYATLHASYIQNNFQSNPNQWDRLGWSVALSGQRLIAGAPGDVVSIQSLSGSLFTLDTNLPDCNGDGIPDACDPDCNNDRVSDLCQIAAGTVGDCDADAQPDECQAGFDYQRDDGTGSDVWGFQSSGAGGDLIWLNTFQVSPGNGFITHVAIAWTGFTPNQTPVTLLLYADPTNDGDPHDAVLLAQAAAAPTSQFGLDGIMHFSIYPVPRTYVGAPGSLFFIGAVASCQPGVFVASTDGVASVGTHNWLTTNLIGQADISNLSNNSQFTTITDNFAVRAISLDCNGNGIADFCDIAAGTSLDLNANGKPDECETYCPADIAPAKTGGDGSVDIDDLLSVINSWGLCPKGLPCPADIAPAGPPQGNGAIDIDDLLAVINAWGACP